MSENSACVEAETVNVTLKAHMELMDRNNDGNRMIISKMYLTEGAAFLGKINLSKGRSIGDILTLYSGQQINNFDFDFCIPAFDRLIIEFIEEWNMNHKLRTLNAIYKRLDILRGEILYWM